MISSGFSGGKTGEIVSRAAAFENENFDYQIYLPPEIKTGARLPLITFLHGIRERGTGGSSSSTVRFPGWPEKPLLITAVDCETGELAVWEKGSQVPIERAIASSCSVPALFPPVTINGRRYTDGGVRSGTSADLAQRIEPDVVLIIATMGAVERGIQKLAARQIAEEKGGLEAAGAKVAVVMFDDAMKEIAGVNLMDPSKREAAAEAGHAHGYRIAEEVGETWG